MAAASGFGRGSSFQSFEPHFQWAREDDCQILLIHLPGFKKEQLKVQLDGYGNLKVSGQRPLAGNQWTGFRKDFRVPENSSTDEIRAKFEDGLLYVIIPKLITLDIPEAPPVDGRRDMSEASKEAPPRDTRTSTTTTPATPTPDGLGAVKTRGGGPKIIPDEEEEEEKKKKVGRRLRWSGAADRRRRGLLLNIAVAVLVLVGLVVYVAHTFGRSQPSNH